MARKSRKGNKQGSTDSGLIKAETAEHPLLPSAAYIRLSSADDKKESSIESQILLVHDFIRKHEDLQLTDTYIDNGFTGTNFDRPEFNRMMQDVRSGRIQCIVVKDLSRFGRDYLEMGYYIETIFPRLGVRFIAVTDDFDNTRPGDVASISVPIKNIVNNYYANDISKKLVTANEARRRQGDLMNGSAPYGYIKDKERDTYIIDENTACYVRVMYQWYLMGISRYEIAERLEFVQAPHPCTTKKAENSGSGRKDDTKWRGNTIMRQLSNPVYTGDLVGGKSRSAQYKGLKKTPTDPDKWVIQKDEHPAVVLRSDYEAVQKIVQENKVKNQKYGHQHNPDMYPSDNPFPGNIYCSCCGRHMAYAKRGESKDGEPYGVFFCPNKTTDSLCGHHTITEKLLKILVMDQIHILIQNACDQKELAQSLVSADGEPLSVVSLKKKINALSGQIDQVEKRRTGLYEDYAGGILDKEEYQYMKEHYIAEKQQKETKMQELQEKLHTLQKKAELCLNVTEKLEPYKDIHHFDEKLVHGLVESVSVGQDNSIQIVFKCQDVYQDLMSSMEEIYNEG